MRPAGRLVSLGFAGALGLAAVMYWQADIAMASARKHKARLETQDAQETKKRIEFKSDAAATILDHNGFEEDLYGYIASDGADLTYVYAKPVGTTSATAEFERRLATADHVVARGPLKDADARVIGERAVYYFSDPRTHKVYVEILWTDGRTLHSLESMSLYHLLEFERQELRQSPGLEAGCPGSTSQKK